MIIVNQQWKHFHIQEISMHLFRRTLNIFLSKTANDLDPTEKEDKHLNLILKVGTNRQDSSNDIFLNNKIKIAF